MMIRVVHDHGDSLTASPKPMADFQVELEALPPLGSEIIVSGYERIVTRIAHIVHVERNGDAQFRGYVVSTKNKRVSSIG